MVFWKKPCIAKVLFTLYFNMDSFVVGCVQFWVTNSIVSNPYQAGQPVLDTRVHELVVNTMPTDHTTAKTTNTQPKAANGTLNINLLPH